MRLPLPLDFRSLSVRQIDPSLRPRLLADGTLIDAGARPGRVPLVLSRGLCRARHFDLSQVTAGDRPTALRHQLTAWAPFDASTFRVFPRRQGHLVIAWDASRVDAALRDAGWPLESVLWCEFALRPPLDDGVRLLACLDGFEAQHWSQGALLRSRWWPRMPDEHQWSMFLRPHPVAGDDGGLVQRPGVDQAPWLAKPWLQAVDPAEPSGSSSAWERLTLGALGLVLLGFSGAQGHLAMQAHQSRQAAAEELSALRGSVDTVLRLRDRAMSQQASATKLTEAMTGVLPLELIGHLDEVLPRKGVVLKDLELVRNRLRLELELGPQVSRSEVIASLQRSAWFVDITEAKPGIANGTVPFELRLRQARAPIVAVLKPAAAEVALPAALQARR